MVFTSTESYLFRWKFKNKYGTQKLARFLEISTFTFSKTLPPKINTNLKNKQWQPCKQVFWLLSCCVFACPSSRAFCMSCKALFRCSDRAMLSFLLSFRALSFSILFSLFSFFALLFHVFVVLFILWLKNITTTNIHYSSGTG